MSHTFEQAYKEVERIHRVSLPKADPVARQIMASAMEQFKPLFKEFYELGVKHGTEKTKDH